MPKPVARTRGYGLRGNVGSSKGERRERPIYHIASIPRCQRTARSIRTPAKQKTTLRFPRTAAAAAASFSGPGGGGRVGTRSAGEIGSRRKPQRYHHRDGTTGIENEKLEIADVPSFFVSSFRRIRRPAEVNENISRHIGKGKKPRKLKHVIQRALFFPRSNIENVKHFLRCSNS